MDNGFSLADIKAVTENNDHDGWGGGSWWILLLFIVMMGGGNGFGWGGRGLGERLATETDMQAGFYQEATGRKLDQLGYGLADLGYENARLANQTQMQVAGGFNDLGARMAQCCCETKQEILVNRYEDQKNTCDIEKAIHAEGEATRSLIQANKIEALQGKIQALELQSALCGVVRYPNATTYNAGPWPFASTGCCNPCYGGTTF